MDVTGVISELRSERDDVEQEILFLERADQHSTRTAEAATQSATEIRRGQRPTKPDDCSLRRPVAAPS